MVSRRVLLFYLNIMHSFLTGLGMNIDVTTDEIEAFNNSIYRTYNEEGGGYELIMQINYMLSMEKDS